MPRGNSGRIVIEVGPETKKELYAALDLSGLTLKDWFLTRAKDFCTEATQPSLFKLSPSPLQISTNQSARKGRKTTQET